MKKPILLLFIVLILNACNFNTRKTDKIQDSIAKADSIKKLFSEEVLKKIIRKEEYKIIKVVKTILADNQDIYIVKGTFPTYYFYLELYNSDERNGSIVIINFDKKLNSVLKLIVTKTQHNLTKDSYEISYICKDPRDNQMYRLLKIQIKKDVFFSLESDFNIDRQKYMQSLMLIPETESK